MIRVNLTRFYTMFETFGLIELPNALRLFTVECPWQDNEKWISCIPEGSYVCTRHDSPSHGETFLVNNVPGRSHILFHVANTSADLHGCIGIAKGPAIFLEKRWGLGNSTKGMTEFMRALTGIPAFELIIKQFRP